MLKLLQALNSLVGMLLALAIVGLLAAGAWVAYQNYFSAKFSLEADLAAKQEEVDRLAEELTSSQRKVERLSEDVRVKDEQIVALNKDIEQKQKEIQRLGTALKFMKVDQRLARISVLSQEGSAEKGNLTTQFSFVDLDPQGNPLGEPRIFNIEGDLVYIDSWVVKFGDEYVEEGDPLRSTSICLFRRLFGESQLPAEGFALDREGDQPAVYRTGGPPSDFEKDLWSRFWDYANNAELAKEKGVRAAHGEAPSIQLRPGRSYRVELRSSGGMSVVPEQTPAPSDTSRLN